MIFLNILQKSSCEKVSLQPGFKGVRVAIPYNILHKLLNNKTRHNQYNMIGKDIICYVMLNYYMISERI